MTDHLMFGDIKLFADVEFFDLHKTGKVRVGETVRRLFVVGYAVIDINSRIYNLREYQNNKNEDALTEIKGSAINWSGRYSGGRIIMLSTCDKKSKYYRDVLVLEVE